MENGDASYRGRNMSGKEIHYCTNTTYKLRGRNPDSVPLSPHICPLNHQRGLIALLEPWLSLCVMGTEGWISHGGWIILGWRPTARNLFPALFLLLFLLSLL